jgi:four helix bundle protein
LKAQLYIALDVEYIDREQFEGLYDLATDVSRLLAGLIRYLVQSDYKGTKFT